MTAALLADYERRFPHIRWREPIRLTRVDGESGYACRVCIAAEGLRASKIPDLPDDPGEIWRHLQEVHGA